MLCVSGLVIPLTVMSGCGEPAGEPGSTSVPDTFAAAADSGASADGAAGAPAGGVEAPGHSKRKTPSEPDLGPWCADWPAPAAAFAFTGQMHGYLEPCGCSEPQYGGISRRATLLRQVEQRGWPVIPIDLGGTLRRIRTQSQFKFQTLLSALRDMKYQALALGVEELQLGAGWLLSQHVTDPDHPEDSLTFLAANVVLFGAPDLGTPVHHRVIPVGNRRVGVTAVFGPKLMDQVGNLAPDEIRVDDPVEPLKAAVEALKAESVDLMVLISHATLAESRELAKKFPEFRLVVSTGPVEEPLSGNPEQIGDTTLAVVGHKGKYVGLVGWYPDSPDRPFRMELVKLDGKRFPDEPRMVEHMRFYQDLLRDAKLAETESALPHPSGSTYVGADKCGECHTKAFAQWKTTGHAQAFESIRTGRRGIPRIHDPECLSCHVTGWHPQDVYRFESGYLNEKASAHLLGNQCENCHGPGSRHIELVESDQKKEARALMHVGLEKARQHCYECHDLDNSPHFDFETYWPQIAHPGLD